MDVSAPAALAGGVDLEEKSFWSMLFLLECDAFISFFSLPCLLLLAALSQGSTRGRAGCPQGPLPQQPAQQIKHLVHDGARGSSEGAAPGVPMSLLEAAAGREQKDLEGGCVAASAPGELSPGVCGVGTRAG